MKSSSIIPSTGPVEGMISLIREATLLAAYVFSGFPRFLSAAADELGLPRSAGPARRISTLTDLANLCAQAAQGDIEHLDEILSKAGEFRDQLATALRAAELMIADVNEGRRPSGREEPKAEVAALEPAVIDPRSSRKGVRSERAPS